MNMAKVAERVDMAAMADIADMDAWSRQQLDAVEAALQAWVSAELLAFCRGRLQAVEEQVKLLEGGADGVLKPWGAPA